MFKWTTVATCTIWTTLMCVLPTQSQMCARCAIGQTCRMVRGSPTCVADSTPTATRNRISTNTGISHQDPFTRMQNQQRLGSDRLFQEPSSFPQPTLTGADVVGSSRTNRGHTPVFPPLARTPPAFERTGQGQSHTNTGTGRGPILSHSWTSGAGRISGRQDQPLQRGNSGMRAVIRDRNTGGRGVGNRHSGASAAPAVPQFVQPRRAARASIIEKDNFGFYYIHFPDNNPAIRVNITKSGFCSLPRIRRTFSQVCDYACESDMQCINDTKCCPNGCNLECLPPSFRPLGHGHGSDRNQGHQSTQTRTTPQQGRRGSMFGTQQTDTSCGQPCQQHVDCPGATEICWPATPSCGKACGRV